MKISAIISEYNPLHKGHKYQIDLTRDLTKCDGLISVMSGNFVQRGEPALIDKWQRAKMALKSGIDLVIELPSVYALSSAEFFAEGAVSILQSLNVVDSLCFGSESGEIEPILEIAEILSKEPEEYKIFLKTFLEEGITFPLARSKAITKLLPLKSLSVTTKYSDILETSNNILAIEYCKSLIRNRADIVPYTIKRLGGDYNSSEISDIFSSATAIRKILKEGLDIEKVKNQLPESTFSIIMNLIEENYNFTYPESIFPYIKYKAATDHYENLKHISDTGEGLYKRIYKFLLASDSLQDLMQAIKTKRYTYTRISRILMQYFIGFDNFEAEKLSRQKCGYIRILGFNSKGAEILKEIKLKSDIDIITKIPKKSENPFLKLDLASTAAYSVINNNIRYNEDFLKSPIIEI